jgi:hypothetical protein
MTPLSWPVAIGTLLVGSPALWAAQVDGTLSSDVALFRLLLCAVGVWAVLSLVVGLVDRAVAGNVVPVGGPVPEPPTLDDGHADGTDR